MAEIDDLIRHKNEAFARLEAAEIAILRWRTANADYRQDGRNAGQNWRGSTALLWRPGGRQEMEQDGQLSKLESLTGADGKNRPANRLRELTFTFVILEEIDGC